jgi:hypothetical protein
MKRVLAAAAAFFCLAQGTVLASTNFAPKNVQKSSELPSPRKTLTVGERMDFEVFWMGVPVGLGSLEVKEKVAHHGREAYHIVAIARTNDFLSKLYPVTDEIHSYIDAENFRSLEFSKNLREGRYRAHERIVYDYDRKVGVWESFKNDQRAEIGIEGDVQDALSAFYWFRLQDVSVGKSVKTLVHNRGKSWDLEVKVLSRQDKELRGRGAIDTILVEPVTRYKDILYKRGRAWVYFTADESRAPVWIKIATPFGAVNGVLR